MSDNRDRAAHLIERAAERLRRDGVSSGMIDGSAAGMLDLGAASRGAPALQPPPPPSPQPVNGARPPAASQAAHDGTDTIAAPSANGADQHPTPRLAGARPGRPRPATLDMGAMIGAGMIDWSKARTRLSEEFRVVQAQVLRAAFADPDAAARPAPNGEAPLNGETRHAANLVMVTSARPREGKSFTSLNLAASIARQRDRDVLLVDIDAKRGSITEHLGLRGQPGLLDLAADPRADPQDLIAPTEMSHLSVLSFGASGDGAELLASRQMARVIRGLGRRFADRIVILDAPPCLASSDASAMAPIVGQIVFVVEAEQTQRQEVEAALDLVQSCPAIMLLLNKVQLRTRHSFGGYYSIYTYN